MMKVSSYLNNKYCKKFLLVVYSIHFYLKYHSNNMTKTTNRWFFPGDKNPGEGLHLEVDFPGMAALGNTRQCIHRGSITRITNQQQDFQGCAVDMPDLRD